MARVLDTIRISQTFRQHVPCDDVPFGAEGLQVILDPGEQTDVSAATGRMAIIRRPDGSQLERMIAGVVVRHGVPALYFEGLSEDEVPRLSDILWT